MGSGRWQQLVLWGTTALCCLLLACTARAREPAAEGPPLLAVVPFSYAPDPDYGVFLSDRLAAELMRYSYFPPLRRRRFVLVESDTLSRNVLNDLVQTENALSEEMLEGIRRRVPAAYMLCGSVEPGGILTLHLRLIDLKKGEVVWTGSVRDNPAWTWSRANRNVGDIPAEAVRNLLGLGEAGTPPPAPAAGELPGEILIQPLYTTAYPALAADCRANIRQALERDGTFIVVSGGVGKGKESRPLPRLNAALRQEACEVTLVDAVLCGSLAVLGRESAIHNVGVVLRLVEVPSGRILWTEAASGRRVWRWDKTRDLVEEVVGQLAEGLAQFGASTAGTLVSRLLENAKDGDGWCAVGEAYLRRGLLAQAKTAFEKALKFPDARPRANNGLGLIYVRRAESFARGVAAFRAAIREAPDFVDAYCNLAQAYLERDMPDGVKFAEQAIKQDVSCSRAYRILGNWYSDREDDARAVTYYERYIQMERDDIDAAVRLGRSLLRLQAYSKIDRLIAPVLEQHPEALALLPVVALKALWTGDYEAAERHFEHYVHQIDLRERMLYMDIRPFLDEGERAFLDGLTDAEKQVFVERFWRKKDPDLTTEANERLLAHYGRVWIARQDFGREVFPWDRRGDVFLRYGEPDYRSRSGMVPRLTSPEVEQVKERVYAELYRGSPPGDLVGPVFPIRGTRGMKLAQGDEPIQGASELSASPQEDYRMRLALEGGPLKSQAEGEVYAPVTTQGDNSIVPWESWVYTDVGGGMVFDFTKEVGSGGGYGFAPIPPIPPATLRSTARLAEYAPEIAFERAVSETPDTYALPSPVPLEDLHYDIGNFRADAWKTRLEVSYSVPMSVLTHVTSGGVPIVLLERSVALADSSYARVYRQSRKVQFPADSAAVAASAGLTVDLVQSDLLPGLYHLTLKVRDAVSGRSKTVKQDVRVGSYAGEALRISDLMLAGRIGDYTGNIRFRRGHLEVVPNPGRIYSAPRMPFYYEIYNLAKDAFGQTHYRVTVGVQYVEHKPGVPAPLRGEDRPQVSLSYEQVGSQDWEQIPLEIDLGKAKEGRNRLTVIVEDLNSHNRIMKKKLFYYRRPGGEAAPPPQETSPGRSSGVDP